MRASCCGVSSGTLARAVLITGASRGLGLELVRQLSKASSRPEIIIATCRNPSDASELQEIAKTKKFVKIVKMDVEIDGDIDNAVKETTALVGRKGLNLLINNAGIFLDALDGGGVRLQTRERMQKTFNVNTTSPIIVTQKFLPLLEMSATQWKNQPMSCQKAACVVISSGMGSLSKTHAVTWGTNLDYKCSKAAVNMAVILMAQDLHKNGILSIAVDPGWTQTDMGGPNADLSPEESALDMIQTMSKAGEKDMGRLIDNKGQLVPF